jgi:predicted Zn-ribbon and HTH transcriptional regulator
MNADGFSSFLVRLAENIISSPDAPAECGFIAFASGILAPSTIPRCVDKH